HRLSRVRLVHDGHAAEHADDRHRRAVAGAGVPKGADMKQYLDLMRHVLDKGTPKSDRTGTGTLSVFGHQMRFDLAAGFPMVTTKKLPMKSIAYELLWFLRGETNIKFLKDHGVTIWDEWADDKGELGP